MLLTADAAAGLLTNVIDAGGTIAAPTLATPAGTVSIGDIRIDGRANGALVDGTVNVSGLKPGQTGGAAIVTGSTATLAPTAKIYARGNAGGGTVEVGGGPHGQDPSVNNAQYTTVASGALIDASATGNGNGGNVAVWSDNTTSFAGTILARGGPQGGDGGWVETSGHNLSVASTAVVDASALAPTGKPGTWLLDPWDLDVINALPPTATSVRVRPAAPTRSSRLATRRMSPPARSIRNSRTAPISCCTRPERAAPAPITARSPSIPTWGFSGILPRP